MLELSLLVFLDWFMALIPTLIPLLKLLLVEMGRLLELRKLLLRQFRLSKVWNSGQSSLRDGQFSSWLEGSQREAQPIAGKASRAFRPCQQQPAPQEVHVITQSRVAQEGGGLELTICPLFLTNAAGCLFLKKSPTKRSPSKGTRQVVRARRRTESIYTGPAQKMCYLSRTSSGRPPMDVG